MMLTLYELKNTIAAMSRDRKILVRCNGVLYSVDKSVEMELNIIVLTTDKQVEEL